MILNYSIYSIMTLLILSVGCESESVSSRSKANSRKPADESEGLGYIIANQSGQAEADDSIVVVGEQSVGVDYGIQIARAGVEDVEKYGVILESAIGEIMEVGIYDAGTEDLVATKNLLNKITFKKKIKLKSTSTENIKALVILNPGTDSETYGHVPVSKMTVEPASTAEDNTEFTFSFDIMSTNFVVVFIDSISLPDEFSQDLTSDPESPAETPESPAVIEEFTIVTPSGLVDGVDQKISWTSANATSYRLMLSTNSDCSAPLSSTDIGQGLEATIQLKSGRKHYICVSAVDDSGTTHAAANSPIHLELKEKTLIYSQVADLTFANELHDAIMTSNGTMIIALTANNLVGAASLSDVMIRYIAADGSPVTAKDILVDINSTSEILPNIAPDKQNGFALSINSTNAVSSTSSQDYALRRYNSDGQLTWSTEMHSAGTNIDSPGGIVFDGDGNWFVGGSFNSYQYSIKKFSSANIEDTSQWNKLFAGQSGNDFVPQVILTNDALFSIGWGSKLTASDAGFDWWVKKFDLFGNEVTASEIKVDVRGRKLNDRLNSGAVGSDGALYLGGVTADGGARDWVIKKYGANGAEVTNGWDKIIDGNGSADNLNQVAIGPDGLIYVVGIGANLVSSASGSDIWVKRFSTDGTEDAAFEIKLDVNAGADSVKRILFDSAGDFYIVGNGTTLPASKAGSGNVTYCILKYAGK